MANRAKTFNSDELAAMRLQSTAPRAISPKTEVGVYCGTCGVAGVAVFGALRHNFLARGAVWRCDSCRTNESRLRGTKNKGANNPFAGKQHTPETREKMRAAAKNRVMPVSPDRFAAVRDKIKPKPTNRRLINELSQQLINLGLDNQNIFIGGHEIHLFFPAARVGVQVINALNTSEPMVGRRWSIDLHRFFLERQIRLIQTYEHELVQRFSQFKNYIAKSVGYADKWLQVSGLEVVNLDNREAEAFFAKNYIKPIRIHGSSDRLGLRQDGVLVAAAVFSVRQGFTFLDGYCEKDRIVVNNGLRALCEIMMPPVGDLVTSLPIRLDDGGLFLGNGWEVDNLGDPDYGLVSLDGNVVSSRHKPLDVEFVKFFDAGKIFFFIG